jgi:hypothetical protein
MGKRARGTRRQPIEPNEREAFAMAAKENAPDQAYGARPSKDFLKKMLGNLMYILESPKYHLVDIPNFSRLLFRYY